MIELDVLCSSYASKVVFQNLSAIFDSGQCVAVFGRNGAGKSTLFRTLVGLKPPTSGSARICGFDCWHQGERARELIGFAPETPVFPRRATVSWVLDFLQAFYAHWDQQFAKELLSHTSISSSDRVGKLSKGNLMQLALVAAIARKPKVLILDEPFGSLDPVSRQIWTNVLRQELLTTIQTCLYSTHSVSDTESICGRVVVISEQKLSFDFETKFKSPRYFRVPAGVNLLAMKKTIQFEIVDHSDTFQILAIDLSQASVFSNWARACGHQITPITIADLLAQS